MILTNFCNPKIPGLRYRKFQDSGLAKMVEIPGFGISGLQSLVLTVLKRHLPRCHLDGTVANVGK